METQPPDRYDKRMNHEQKDHYFGFYEDVRAHMEAGVPTAQDAIDALTALAFNAITTIEKIKRNE